MMDRMKDELGRMKQCDGKAERRGYDRRHYSVSKEDLLDNTNLIKRLTFSHNIV